MFTRLICSACRTYALYVYYIDFKKTIILN